MNKIANLQAMSSIEIAQLTNKRHDNVVRDIRDQLFIGLYGYEFGTSNLSYPLIQGLTVVTDSHTKRTQEILLDRYHTDILISGYEVKYRAAIVKRWHELELQVVPIKTIENKDPLINAKNIDQTSKHLLSLAKRFGLSGNQALLSADKATKALTGVSPLALLDHTLIAEVKEKLLTPTDIGLQLDGISAKAVNKLLEK